MDKGNLKYSLAQHTERKLPDVVPRTLQLPLGSGKVVTFVGIRLVTEDTKLRKAAPELCQSLDEALADRDSILSAGLGNAVDCFVRT